MAQLIEAYLRDRDALTKDIRECGDVKAASDLLVTRLDAYRAEAAGALAGQASRQALNRLCAVATEGIRMLPSVSKADVTLRPAALPVKKKMSLKEMAAYLPSALCMLLTAFLAFDQEFGGAGLAIVSAAVSYVMQGRRPAYTAETPVAEAVPMLDADETMRRFERLLRVADEALEGDAPARLEAPSVTRGMLESVQMLMEARLSGDGAFALRTIPQMADALGREGISMCMYSEADKQYFDLLPAPKGGETIRPALIKDGVLLSRGQATCEIPGAAGRN